MFAYLYEYLKEKFTADEIKERIGFIIKCGGFSYSQID